jgi:hypothetical protein
MKTLLIFTDFEGLAQFAVLDGDYSHLHETVINMCPPEGDDEEAWDKKCDELSALLYDPENGDSRVKFSHEFPTEDVRLGFYHGNLKVIQVGFLP